MVRNVGSWLVLRFPGAGAGRTEVDDTGLVYGYSDETEFPCPPPNGPKRVGTAIFLTGTPVGQEVIDDAMERLERRPRLSAADQRTIHRGHFHASHDSSAARAALGEAIRDRVQGSFYYHYRDPALRPPRKGKPKVHRYQEQMLRLGVLAMSSTRAAIKLQVENRHRAQHLAAPEWLEGLNKLRERVLYDKPSLPMLFPRIDITVEGKATPGLQIVDRLLWAVNRSKSVQAGTVQTPSDEEHLEAVGLEPVFGHVYPDGGDRGGLFYVGRELLDICVTYPSGVPVPDTLGPDGLFRAWCMVETCLHHFTREELSEHAAHHEDGLKAAALPLRGNHANVRTEHLRAAASAFIRLFDTVPLYDGVGPRDTERWELLLFARRMAALVQRRDLVHGSSALSAVARWRRRTAVESPEFFGLLPT